METNTTTGAMVTLNGKYETDPETARRVAERVKKALDEPAPGTTMWYERKIRELEQQLELQKFVTSYALDLIQMWPSTTLRTLYKITAKIEDLKQAIQLSDIPKL